MITFQEEPWDAIADDLRPVYEQEHSPETRPFHDQLTTSLNHGQYEALAKTGALFCLTGRAGDGTLVAYYLGVKGPFPSTHTPTCFVTLYFVRPAWRSRGIGRQLFEAAERHLQHQGVEVISAVSKFRTGAGRGMFEATGFVAEEVVYLKWIGEEA